MGRPVNQNAKMEVTSRCSMQGQTILNVWHYTLTGGAAGTYDGDAIQAALRSEIGLAVADDLPMLMRAFTNEAVDFLDLRYQWIWPTRYSPVYSGTGSGPGAIAETPLPANVAATTTITTEVAGPAGRGSKHWGGLSITDLDAGFITATLKGHLDNVMQLMGQVVTPAMGAGGNSLVPIVYHRAAPNASYPWSQFIHQNTSRVMRRRTVGVGI